MKWRVLEDARNELAVAANWYDAEQLGLGLKLLEAVENAFDSIQLDPGRLPIAEFADRSQRNIRQCRVHRFPYLVIYKVSENDDEISVLAISHLRRKPGYWHDRQ